MVSCITDCIEKPIRMCLENIGKFVGLHPWWFVTLPLAVSAGLGGGFLFLHDLKSNDIVEQFTPKNGRAKVERRFFQETFPQIDTQFSVLRLNTDGVFASLIFSCQTNVLSVGALDEILRIDGEVRGITANHSAKQFGYSDICATVNGTCYPNVLLDVLNYNASNIQLVNITFPLYCQSESNCIHFGNDISEVEVDDNGVVESAKAMRLFFYLQENNNTGDIWLQEFVNLLSNITSSLTEVSYFTSMSRQQEFEKSTTSVTQLFAITYFLAISFSIISCMRLDNVRNKVWLASLGVFATAQAVMSSFGLLLLMNVPFVITVASSPFLILGIGIDDMFIMISSWQRTNVQDTVPDRMAETYREAAISITITTLTDVLAFYLSYSNPFGSVQSFCLYAGTAVFFCYLYNITFFGACLALNGRREGENRHWLTCMKVPEDCPPGQSKGYAVCCVGGAYNHNTGTEKELPMTLFFRKYYGPFVTRVWTKALIFFIYLIYIAISVYGCLKLKEGINLKNLALDESYIVQYYEAEKTYFDYYGPNVMVAVNSTFPYWEESERNQLESCIIQFQELDFVKNLSISWLHSFEKYAVENHNEISSETAFKTNLYPFLDHNPMLRQDVKITNNDITASRLFLQTFTISSEKIMLNSLRKTAENCPYPLLVYHPAFIYYDQYTVIGHITVQTMSVATAVMLVIALVLIPNPLCALWVAFAIASVILGVTGFMALLNINLDSISMINLVICIGFSVDFSAHISYTFVSSAKSDANERVVEALTHLGYPILQGALSTIVGVVVLSASTSYIFRTLFTIVFLVITFGLLHGIAFLPVFLTFFGFCHKLSQH
ncbi:patched domain-containing protein 3-like [Myxocyprinus asiaticus]|uniref:patched domain-containing protein 3-like n=1 Tax=Myxocyprinus asiaticus TaxID=70543 RepID=UPI002222EF27|nr:patched domain-containing protein 3-like [Myxocyprinus asiaticus]